jgi:hypothetical protein
MELTHDFVQCWALYRQCSASILLPQSSVNLIVSSRERNGQTQFFFPRASYQMDGCIVTCIPFSESDNCTGVTLERTLHDGIFWGVHPAEVSYTILALCCVLQN